MTTGQLGPEHRRRRNNLSRPNVSVQLNLACLSLVITTCALITSVKSKFVSLKPKNYENRINIQDNSTLIRIPVIYDKDPMKLSDEITSVDDDEDEDELDDDSEEFYNVNPVDQPADAQSIVQDIDRDDLYLKNKDFDDSSSNEIDNLYNITRKSRNKNHHTGRIQPHGSGSRSHSVQTMSPSENVNNQLQQINCALILTRGICITFDSVERAINRARSELELDISQESLQSSEPDEATINDIGQLVELTTRILSLRYQLTWWEIAVELERLDLSRTSLWRFCPLIFRVMPTCPQFSRYRSHTGQCNNLMATHLGSTNMPFLRMLPAEYADGIGVPRRASMSRGPLPPARIVVLNLHPTLDVPSTEHSALFMGWGQLVNHDLAMASAARATTGHGRSCCPRLDYRGLCMPIEIGPGDPVYSQVGQRCHEFKRSLAGLRPGCSLGPRTQLNTITSFIDLSFVYGSSRSMMNSLRQTERGLLEMWNLFREEGLKPMLPPQRENPDEECVRRTAVGRQSFCFRSGDLRTNQHVQLVALHTIHARQHNRLALALGQLNPHWTNNRIYHEARHIHIAIVQHILLNEYLPAVLGSKLCKVYNLSESPLGSYWDHYDPSINPGISQAFAAAAFRHGHTRVPSMVYRFSVFHQPLRAYALRDLYRQPWPLYEAGALDQFLVGMVDTPSQSFDPFLSLEVSGHLLKMPNERVGLDLAAINIQRGRDQGLAGYNAYREWCGLKRASTFDDLLRDINSQSVEAMSYLYESVDDIDLFSGGLSEYPLAGAQVGPTFACIIGRQFEVLRSGDRFWYESSTGPHAFTLPQLDSIKQISLARLICINSDAISTIQEMALQQAHPILNPIQPCASLPDLDISLWLEPAVVNLSTG